MGRQNIVSVHVHIYVNPPQKKKSSIHIIKGLSRTSGDSISPQKCEKGDMP